MKLVLVTIVLILAAVIPIAYQSSALFESSFAKSQYETSALLAESKSSQIDDQILSYVEKIRTTTNLLLQNFASEEQRKRALDLVFFHDLDLVNIEIYELKDGSPSLYRRETNDAYLKSLGFDQKYMSRLRAEKPFPIMAVFSNKDKIHIKNSTLPNGVPLFTVAVPFADRNDVVRHISVADIRLDRLQKAFNIRRRTLYLVDNDGTILAHTNDRHAINGTNFSHLPIVTEALTVGQLGLKGTKRFQDPETTEWYLGAYNNTAFGPTVIAQVPEAPILEQAKQIKNSAFEWTGYVLSGALFFVIVFSITLTLPIEKLYELTLHVARGNFDIKARIESGDEVGSLASAFNQMVDGLKERDKIKSIFNKFHGSSVTDDLMQRDLDLGGTKKEVTIFFSDIRDFTKFSEGHTPEEVVEMLNEYFQIMVGIITSHHGIVDKFVGDAIMAVWGAPKSTGEDREHAIAASLEMRMALAELNERRIERGHVPIKIGIGLHTGPAISGTIGSTERMEYTVIGDTVNMASRIEASTKAFGSDLLISETTMQGLESKFVFEVAGAAEVKGKSQPIKMFKVRGYYDENSQPVELRTTYSDFETGDAEKVKIAV